MPKKKWFWLLIIGLASISAISVFVWRFVLFIDTLPSEEEAAIVEMNAILQAARDNPFGPPPESIQRWALLRPGDRLWIKLQKWMSDAPGPYRLEFVAGDFAYSPGDDTVVSAKLSNDIAITCTFYNSTLIECAEIEE